MIPQPVLFRRSSPFSVLCLVSIFFLAATASARSAVDSESETGTSTAGISSQRSSGPAGGQFSIGYEYSNFAYREPGLMTDQGSLNGVTAQFDLLTPNLPLHFTFQSDLLFGILGYTGQKWDGTPVDDSTEDLLFNLRALAGVDFTGRKTLLEPFVGIGLRYLNDNGQSDGAYEREITYYYVPIGGRVAFQLTPRAAFGFTLEYDYFLSGTVQTHLSQLNVGYPDLTNNQSSGEGYRFAMDYDYRFTRYGLKIEPYWQHWDVDNSDVQPIQGNQTGMEPANSTDLVGLNLMLQI